MRSDGPYLLTPGATCVPHMYTDAKAECFNKLLNNPVGWSHSCLLMRCSRKGLSLFYVAAHRASLRRLFRLRCCGFLPAAHSFSLNTSRGAAGAKRWRNETRAVTGRWHNKQQQHTRTLPQLCAGGVRDGGCNPRSLSDQLQTQQQHSGLVPLLATRPRPISLSFSSHTCPHGAQRTPLHAVPFFLLSLPHLLHLFALCDF